MINIKKINISLQKIFQKIFQIKIWIILLGIILVISSWELLSDFSLESKLVFVMFILTMLAWIATDIEDSYIAVISLLGLALINHFYAEKPNINQIFFVLGDSMIWLMLSAFIIASAIKKSQIIDLFLWFIGRYIWGVKSLFWGISLLIFSTSFMIPATSGRAALLLPIFYGLIETIQKKIDNPNNIIKSLSLLFPVIILLSAFASLTGAGGHILMADIVYKAGYGKIDFLDWLTLGMPFALLSCASTVLILLYFFMNKSDRNNSIIINNNINNYTNNYKNYFVLLIIILLIGLWASESWHGISSSLIGLFGALLLTMPKYGLISFKLALKEVEWSMLLFMAATTALADALIKTGAAKFFIQKIMQLFTSEISLIFIIILSVIGLLSHILIHSRSARVSILVPLALIAASNANYSPILSAIIITAATGFCISLPISAKPVALYSQLSIPTYSTQDLLKLSFLLLPIHLGLLIIFALTYWKFIII